MLVAVAARHSDSTATMLGRAPAAAAAVAGLSAAHGHCPSEVRSGPHNHAARAMHAHAPHHLHTLINTTMTGRTLHQPRACISLDA